jgi:hypothetical protein
MTLTPEPRRPSPAEWAPTLYFAEGLPFYAVNFMALLFYQRMGVSNAVTTVVVSLLAWPWTLKPLWSPLLEMYRTKKYFVVLMQLLGGAGLLLLALVPPLPGYFAWSIAILTVVAFASSTHDIAADGVYIASLSPKQQAAYAGWCGAFYNVARIFSMGGLICQDRPSLPPGRPRERRARPHPPAVRDERRDVRLRLPGAVSGWIQEQLGYRHFFVWVLVSAIPAVVLSRFIPIRGGEAPPAVAGAEDRR